MSISGYSTLLPSTPRYSTLIQSTPRYSTLILTTPGYRTQTKLGSGSVQTNFALYCHFHQKVADILHDQPRRNGTERKNINSLCYFSARSSRHTADTWARRTKIGLATGNRCGRPWERNEIATLTRPTLTRPGGSAVKTKSRSG